MAYQPRDNSGSLFKNDYKTKESHPDYKGKAIINGEQLEVAAWIKKGQKGTFMSLSFSPPRPRQESMGEYQGEPEEQRQAPPHSRSRPAGPRPGMRPAPMPMPPEETQEQDLPF